MLVFLTNNSISKTFTKRHFITKRFCFDKTCKGTLNGQRARCATTKEQFTVGYISWHHKQLTPTVTSSCIIVRVNSACSVALCTLPAEPSYTHTSHLCLIAKDNLNTRLYTDVIVIFTTSYTVQNVFRFYNRHPGPHFLFNAII